MPTARGSLDVNTEAKPPFLDQDGLKLNHNVVRKEFSGDIVGASEAQMIAAFTGTPGSAGYVAIEHFHGHGEWKVGLVRAPAQRRDEQGGCPAYGHDRAGLGHRRARGHLGDARDRQRRG